MAQDKKSTRENGTTRKKFSLAARIDEAKTANRFGLTREDVQAEILKIERDRANTTPIEVSVTQKRSEMHDYMMDSGWGYTDMVHMMAVAHTELVARAIAKPETYGRVGLKALSDIAKQIYPPQKVKVKRRLPAGDTKEDVLERVLEHGRLNV